MWTPTIQYLTEEIPGSEFHILPLDLEGMSDALEQRKVDFILTNSGNYVELESRFGVTRIATLRNLRRGEPYTVFGAVIFVRSDRDDLRTLADLNNRSFGAVDEAAFGGFQMAWRELKKAGVDPFNDFSNLRFFGFPQDKIVLGVRDGEIDAGSVRTDILERMAAEGQIQLEDFRVLNPQKSKDFPFRHSTRLYPEWAFAKTPWTTDKLAETVAIALMKMAENDPAAVAGRYAGWTVPLNYQPVHELFKELEIGPYRRTGDASFRDVMTHYWYVLVLVLAAILLSLVHNFLVKRQVVARTRELSRTNRMLKKEVLERRKAEEDARVLLEQKRLLAQKCMEVQEDERHHLARELHDELGQCITAIQADAKIIQELSKGCDAALEASASAIEGVSSRIYGVVHSMMQRLRPSMLDDVGLVETLKEEVEAWQARQPDTVYRLNIDSNLRTLADTINISIYRIVQECLTNIAKHAMATEVTITLSIIEGSPEKRVRLEIRDNGVGMDPQSSGGGFGMIGMRERAEALNGEFGFSATPGGGMKITATLPLFGKEQVLQH
jgi:two-component system sensor histidine kinase TtrS